MAMMTMMTMMTMTCMHVAMDEVVITYTTCYMHGYAVDGWMAGYDGDDYDVADYDDDGDDDDDAVDVGDVYDDGDDDECGDNYDNGDDIGSEVDCLWGEVVLCVGVEVVVFDGEMW